MVHISELSEDNIADVNAEFKEGDDSEFNVLASDADERKFSLSRKALIKNLEGSDLDTYIGSLTEPKTGLAEAFAKAKADTHDAAFADLNKQDDVLEEGEIEKPSVIKKSDDEK